MKAFWKFILVKDIAENIKEEEAVILTEEEIEEQANMPQPNVPPTAFARFVEVVSVGQEIDDLIAIGTKIYIPHYAGDIIDEGIRIIGINSVLAIEE